MINTFCPKCGEQMQFHTTTERGLKLHYVCPKCYTKVIFEHENSPENPEKSMKTPETREKI